jgi:hypothetical protein
MDGWEGGDEEMDKSKKMKGEKWTIVEKGSPNRPMQ